MEENETKRRTRTRRTDRNQTGSKQRARRRRPANRARARRRRKRNRILRILVVCFIIAAALAGAFLWKRYSPSKEKADLNNYYGIEQDGQTAVILNDEVIEDKAVYSDGEVYVRYDTVKTYLNDRFYWDSNENLLLYTLPDGTVSAGSGSREYTYLNDGAAEDYVIAKADADATAYIALDFICKYTNMEYTFYENPNRIVVRTEWGDVRTATVKRDTQVRYRGGVKSPILTEISKGDEVIVLDSEENWKKVCTEDGFIGYVRKSALKKAQTQTLTHEFEEPDYTGISKDETIVLGWHNVTNQQANDTVMDRLTQSKGLTTIAPTWYHVKNTDGDLESISSADYVTYAHQVGVEVWATLRDFDGGISSNDESYAFLSSTSKRENLINQLIADAVAVKIDGINLDFEKISEECGDHYIQFVRELSVRCRQNNLVLSVDNYVPKGYNTQYNRKEQGIVADYVVIMGYDEHYGGDVEAGSVASYNFVKEGVEETLKEVSADKIILGVPFFTRLWEETPKTEEEIAQAKGTENEDYTMNVESQSLTMEKAKETLSQAGVQSSWDEETQQNYATWQEDDITYEIWLEDTDSLKPRLQLMKDDALAGMAAWALGQETSDIWTLIQQYVN